MSTSTADEQRIAAFKEATNFRSVTRNDPSVLEIIDTSVYSVIYHYDEQAGSWEKQKQEGPLFVVKRCVTNLSLCFAQLLLLWMRCDEGHG